MFVKSTFFLLLISSLFFVQLNWKPLQLDERVAVSFPNKVGKMEMEHKPVWLSEVDSAANCMVMVTDLKKMGVDAKTLAEMLKKKETYQSVKSGILAGSEGLALKESITKFRNYPAYYIELDMKGKPDELNKVYMMNVYIGTKLYSLSFMETYQSKHVEERRKFFESFKAK